MDEIENKPMDDQENKPIEEKETTGKIVEYKKIFSVIVWFYFAAFIINLLQWLFEAAFDVGKGLLMDLEGTKQYELAAGPDTVVCSIAILISLIFLIKAEFIRSRNKAPNRKYVIILSILAIVSWLLFLFFCSSILYSLGANRCTRI